MSQTLTFVTDSTNVYLKMQVSDSPATYMYIKVVADGQNNYKVDAAAWGGNSTTPPTPENTVTGTNTLTGADVFEGVGRVVYVSDVATSQSLFPSATGNDSVGTWFVNMADGATVNAHKLTVTDPNNTPLDYSDDVYSVIDGGTPIQSLNQTEALINLLFNPTAVVANVTFRESGFVDAIYNIPGSTVYESDGTTYLSAGAYAVYEVGGITYAYPMTGSAPNFSYQTGASEIELDPTTVGTYLGGTSPVGFSYSEFTVNNTNASGPELAQTTQNNFDVTIPAGVSDGDKLVLVVHDSNSNSSYKYVLDLVASTHAGTTQTVAFSSLVKDGGATLDGASVTQANPWSALVLISKDSDERIDEGEQYLTKKITWSGDGTADSVAASVTGDNNDFPMNSWTEIQQQQGGANGGSSAINYAGALAIEISGEAVSVSSLTGVSGSSQKLVVALYDGTDVFFGASALADGAVSGSVAFTALKKLDGTPISTAPTASDEWQVISWVSQDGDTLIDSGEMVTAKILTFDDPAPALAEIDTDATTGTATLTAESDATKLSAFDVFNDTSSGSAQATGGAFSVDVNSTAGLVFGIPTGTPATSSLKVALQGKVTTNTVLETKLVSTNTEITYTAAELATALGGGETAAAESPIKIFAWFEATGGDSKQDVGEAYVSASVTVDAYGVMKLVPDSWIDLAYSDEYVAAPTVTYTETTNSYTANSHSATDLRVPESIDYAVTVDVTKSGVVKIMVERGGFTQTISKDFATGDTSVTGTLDQLVNGKSSVSVQVLYDDGTKTLETAPQSVEVYRYKPTVLSIDLVDGDGTHSAPAGEAWYRVKFDRAVDGVDPQDFEWNGPWNNITLTQDASDKSVWVLKSGGGQLTNLSLRGETGATLIIPESKDFVDSWGISATTTTDNHTFFSDTAGDLAVKVWEATGSYTFDKTTTAASSFTVAVDGSTTKAVTYTASGWTPTSGTTYFVETSLTPTSGTVTYAKAGYWVKFGSMGAIESVDAATVRVDFDTSNGWVYPNDDGSGSLWKDYVDLGVSIDSTTGRLGETSSIYYHGVKAALSSASEFSPPQQDFSNLFYGYEGRPSDPYLNAEVVIDPTDTNTTDYPGKNGPGGVDTLDARLLSTGSSTINLLHGYVDTHTAAGQPGVSYTIGEFDRVLLGGTGNTVVGRDDVSETFVIYDDTRVAASTDATKINSIFAGDSALSELGGQVVDVQVIAPQANSNSSYKVTVDIQGYVSRWMEENPDAVQGITVKQGTSSIGVVDIVRVPVAFDAPIGASRYELTLDSTAGTALTGSNSGVTVEMGPNNVYLKPAETDIVDYSHLTTGGIKATLGQDGLDANAYVKGGDLLVDVEGVIGTDFTDAIRGNDETNVLIGMGGDDRMQGMDGADILFGGDGYDLLTGGAGNDFMVDLEGGALLMGGSRAIDGVTLTTTANSKELDISRSGIEAEVAIGDYVGVSGDFTGLGGLTPAQIMSAPLKVIALGTDSITVELATAAGTADTYASSTTQYAGLVVKSRETGEEDVFIVGGGKAAGEARATIGDFQFSGNNAGLTGRALDYSADKIGLHLSAMLTMPSVVAAISAAAESKSQDWYEAAADWIRNPANVAIATTDLGNGDLEVYAYNPSNSLTDAGGTTLTSQIYASVVIAGGQKYLDDANKDASVVRLDDVAGMEWQLPMGLTYSSVDVDSVTGILDDIINPGALQSATVFFALEATAKGTVRTNKDVDGGVMQGALDQQPAIFNPGHGDQRMLGQRENDTYEFITQDFSTVPGYIASNAGRDRIFDLGGNNDTLSFTDALISDLHVSAVSTGRESANNSLRIDYTQANGSVMNEGTVFWQGHYQGSARFSLETIEVSNGNAQTPGSDLYQVGRDIADGLYAIGVKLTAANTTAGYKGAIMAGQREGDLFNIMWDGASDQKVYISDFDHGADHLLFSQEVSGTLTASSWGITSSGSGGLNVSNSGHVLEIILMDGGSINPEDVLATIPM